MSAGADRTPPMCVKCGKRWGTVVNRLIGGLYCQPCDRYITSPAPDLEAQYNARVAAQKKEPRAKLDHTDVQPRTSNHTKQETI